MRLAWADKLALYGLAGWNALGVAGVRTHPPAAIWVLTRRCFYTCLHCDSWRDETPIDRDALDRVADRLAEARTRMIALSGGEPMMVKSLPQIVARLKRARKVLSINTNGHLLEENLDWILDEGVDHVQISIDGHEAGLHDCIRQQPGSFDKILRGMELLRTRRNGVRPRISVCGTVMKQNRQHIVDLVERFEGVADAVELQPIHDSPGLLATSGAEPFADDDRAPLRLELDTLRRRRPSFDDSFHAGFERFLFEPQEVEQVATDHCMPMIFNTLTIRDGGSCYLCRYPLGSDLLSSSVEEVWNGRERWRLYAELSREGCREPCWLRCNHHRSPAPGRVLKQTLRLSA